MDDDILQEFLAESWENLGRLDTEIVALEKSPGDADLLASIFRTIHTIKGTCGFIGLTQLGAVAQAAESVLGRMRDGGLMPTPATMTLVLEAVEVVKDLLRGLEATGEEPADDHAALRARLQQLATTGDLAPSAVVEPLSTANSRPSPQPRDFPRPEILSTDDARPTSLLVEPQAIWGAAPVEPAASLESDAEESVAGHEGRHGAADLSLRVDVHVLDELINLVGELSLARNRLLQLVRGDDDSPYAAPIAHLSRITAELQEGVLKTRMRFGGTVEPTSVDGAGVAVRIHIPLTPPIISAVMVESGGETFAIPLLGVVELVRLAAEDRGRIERIHHQDVLRLRDRLLPLVRLDRLLGLGDPLAGDPAQDVAVVVVQAGDDRIGLIVSDVSDIEDIVVKPVGPLLTDIGIYQGATILGDGRVILILDVRGIATDILDTHHHVAQANPQQLVAANDELCRRTRIRQGASA